MSPHAPELPAWYRHSTSGKKREPVIAEARSATAHDDSTASAAYAELHCLSNFSFQRGASQPHDGQTGYEKAELMPKGCREAEQAPGKQ